MAAKALGEDGSPGAKVEQTQHQIQVIQSFQILGRECLFRRKPFVVRTTETRPPGRHLPGHDQAQREQRANGRPLKGGHKVLDQQSTVSSLHIP